MLDIAGFSSRFAVRSLTEADADDILAFCLQNSQYYRYCGKQPQRELILHDLRVTPPGKTLRDKYYVGFFDRGELAAVLDLIEGYPDDGACFVGFFMMSRRLQGRQIGSGIVQELFRCLKERGFARVLLGIDKDNPQSTHFWIKNGFAVIREVAQEGGTILLAERTL